MRADCFDEPASFRNIWWTSFLLVISAAMLFLVQHRHPENKLSYAHAAESLGGFWRGSAQLDELLRGAAQEDPVPDERFVAESQMTKTELLARWQPLIAEAAQRFAVPAAWIRAVMKTESGGRTMLGPHQQITSVTGAMGLMQVMPDTYEQMRRRYGLGADPYDPRDNVLAGAAYLRSLHERYGNPGMFAAYNDGPGHFRDHIRHGRPLPEETRNYLHRIVAALKDRMENRPFLGVEPRIRLINAAG